MRHRTKFREDRSNRSGDMADYRFFKMASAAILDFENFKLLTVATLKRVELHVRSNFVEIAQTAAEIFQFFKMAAIRHLGFSKVGNFNFRTHSEAQYAAPYQILR